MIEMTFTGAEVLDPAGFTVRPLAFAEGRIAAAQAGRVVDLTGYRLLPGIVDLHGDGFERHLAPRRGAQQDLAAGLLSLEADLAANGITTAILAQFWSWEGGMRSPDAARALADALAAVRSSLLCDLRIQLRLETHLIEDFDDVADFVAEANIGYLVYNDHLPHDALAKGRKPPRLTGQALKSGRSPEAHWDLLKRLHERSEGVPAALEELAQRLSANGVLLGSHDDKSAEARQKMQAIGASVAEFPETLEAAQAGDTVVMGAPNVVRGGSHDKNVSARDVIGAGACTALASDYHYPTLAKAAGLLAPAIGWPAAWDLVSAAPARVLGLTDRGHLDAGARADFLVTEADTGQVCATFAGGQVAYLRGELAARLIG